MIQGRELIFLLDKDRFVANNKVRMKLYPKDEEKDQLFKYEKQGIYLPQSPYILG